MAIYLEYDGIEGSVTTEGFERCVKINSVNFGVARPITMETGNMDNREVGKPHLSEVTLGKEADSSTVAFFKEVVSCTLSKKAILKFTRTVNDNVEEFMQYSLENCLVSSYQISVDDNAMPYEYISLSFTKCELKCKNHDANDKTSNPQSAGYDLEKSEPL